MHLKAQKKLYVKLIFGTFQFGPGKALWTAFVAAWKQTAYYCLDTETLGQLL